MIDYEHLRSTQLNCQFYQTQLKITFYLSLLFPSFSLLNINNLFQPPQTEIDLLFDLHHLDQPIELIFFFLHYLLILVVDQRRNDLVQFCYQLLLAKDVRLYRLGHLRLEFALGFGQQESQLLYFGRVVPVYEGFQGKRRVFQLFLYCLDLHIYNFIAKHSNTHPTHIQIFITLPMSSPRTCNTHTLPILLFCVAPSCSTRLLCLRCADGHRGHDLVSISYFTQSMLKRIQVNAANKDRSQIVKDLSSCKEQMLQKINKTRNIVDALFGDCEDRIDRYFSKIFYSLAEQTHQDMLHRFQANFTSQNITDFINRIDQIQKITLGSSNETKALIYANMEQYRQKINEIVQSATQQIGNLKKYIEQMSLARPETFRYSFSREKMDRSRLVLSDGGTEVERYNSSGGFPLCLLASPFSPCNTRITFKLQRVEAANKSIALGVCLQSIVKGYNYSNCMGIGKGVYAIDQNCPYYSTNNSKMMSSWNHHDTTFNQSNVGSTDLVGWNIKEGDSVSLELDYYNSVLTFFKGGSWDMEEDEVYEMPVKLDQGVVFPFVSLGAKGDRVSISYQQIEELPQEASNDW